MIKEQLCQKCNKIFKGKSGLSVHNWAMHTEKGRLFSKKLKGVASLSLPAWNKGLTKDIDDRIKKISEHLKVVMKQKFINGTLGGCRSKQYIGSKRHREGAAKCGGYKKRAGIGKKFYVYDSTGKKVCLQSSYEKRYYDILLERNIKWIRPKYIYYNIDNKQRKYYPDFYLPKFDIYIDTKNSYLEKIDNEKIKAVIKQNNINLQIINEHNLDKNIIMLK